MFIHRLLLICCLPILMLLAEPLHAEAHAQYDHSLPAANASLPSGQPPISVQVWFTEEIEPDFSRLQVFNQQKQRVDNSDSHAMQDPHTLTISLHPHLPDGSYTVVFKNVSREDGHTVVGSFSFVVGGGRLPQQSADLTNESEGSQDNFNPWSISIRWLNYLAMALLVGSLSFWLLIWLLTYHKIRAYLGPEYTLAHSRFQVRIEQLVRLSLILLAIGWLAFLLYQGSSASGQPLWSLFSGKTLESLLFRSRFGVVWLARLLLLILAVPFWFLMRRSFLSSRSISKVEDFEMPDQKRSAEERLARRSQARAHGNRSLLPAILLLLNGCAIMLTTSLNSHAAASTYAWGLVPLDLLHLICTGLWLGGLAALVLALPVASSALQPGSGDRTRLFADLIPRFSRLAILSTLLLTFSGTIPAVTQLGSFENLLKSDYGHALLVKLGIFAILLVLGASHLLGISPRLKLYAKDPEAARSFDAGKLQRRFRRSVTSEAIFALLLLVSVGGLTSLGPLQSTATAQSQGFLQQGQAGDLTYRIAISSERVGSNTFEISLKNQAGHPIEKAEVLLRLTMLDMDMGTQQITIPAVTAHPGEYSTVNPLLSMNGHWQVTLLIRRANVEDVKSSFEFDIASTSE